MGSVMSEQLSPRRLAEVIGVSESSIKRWVDAGRIASTLTPGGHRRISLRAAIRFVRESGTAPVEPTALGLPAVGTRGQSDRVTDWAEELYRQLLNGRFADSVALVRALYASGQDSAEIIDGTFRVVMERFGKLWHDSGEKGIYLEHRATQIGVRILTELRALQNPPPASAPIALGGAPEGDPYLLPTQSVATVLESVGFAASNLGPETPDGAFVSAIDRLRPALVWLSLTVDRSLVHQKRTIRTVGREIERVGGSLVLGGQAVADMKHVDSLVSFRGGTLVELAAFAKGVLAAARRSGTPEGRS
jgi:excisionase family DNA binding protein